VVGSKIVVAEVERPLVDLLVSYKDALKFAVDMPVLGRCEVSGGRFRRWGARFYTRLYVETHVRKHLQAIRSRLRLELMGTTAPKDRDQVMALEADLARQVEPRRARLRSRWRSRYGGANAGRLARKALIPGPPAIQQSPGLAAGSGVPCSRCRDCPGPGRTRQGRR
jgi:hypothetical protein